jgi:hypothetical protein
MRKLLNLFSLKKEAWLFDSRLYILKSFLSVITVYAIASYSPLLKKDMISLLFGLLLTLEPVTLTGIRSGFNQISATILGAVCTAIIITLFGINIWTVALSITVTLFVCLKINWKVISAVALFTSIYMTQYVQMDASGLPSAYLTFQVRIAALSTGVLVAILYNFLFSLFSYKKMEVKRISYILHSMTSNINNILEGIYTNNMQSIANEKPALTHIFSDIDSTYHLLLDKEKEYNFKDKLYLPTKINYNSSLKTIITCCNNITHLIYDINYTILDYNDLDIDKNICNQMKVVTELLKTYGTHFENNNMNYSVELNFDNALKDKLTIQNDMNYRIIHNLEGIYNNLSTVHEEIVNNI